MPNSKKKSQTIFSVRELTYLALLTAACVVGRILFQFIPNFQPMTAIFLIIAVLLGIFRSLLVSFLSVVITSLYFGIGIWTVEQLLAFSLIIVLFGAAFRYLRVGRYVAVQIVLSFLVGFLYGLVFSIMDFFVYGMTTFLPYYLQGLPFDFMHGLGNALFYGVLFPVLSVLLKRYSPSDRLNR